MKPFQSGRFTDREHTLARLASEIGRGRDAIYHGTRHPQEVLRGGRLKPDPTNKVSLSRSPEVAAHFALLPDDGIVRWSPAVLVLNRNSLVQTYRLEPWRYGEDWDDEQEEVIWGRTVSFRRHLLGVVREADLTKVLGATKRTYREELKAGDKLVRDGRARVRDAIVSERKQRSIESARLLAAPTAAPLKARPAAATLRSAPYRF
jgi:hypothetical protein